MTPLNLTRPPFRIIPGQSAEEAAVDIVTSFNSIEILPNKVSWIFKTLFDCIALEPHDPLHVAGHNIAKAIDGAAHIQDKPYHNSQHVCEVMLSAYYLSLLGNLNKEETAEIVLAALVHDFRHDGKFNGDILFRLERFAVDESLPYLTAARTSPAQQKKIAALILGTEIIIGGAVVQAGYAYHNLGGSLPDIPSAAPELGEIYEDSKVSIQALVLCEADILPSIGLTLNHACRLQKRLGEEWGVSLGLEDKLKFIDTQCHAFIVGDFFNTNVARLRSELVKKLADRV